MNDRERLTWARLQAFDLDDASAEFRFSDRLARENGWTHAYALRVIEEYKRFLFLCCFTDQGVTPSDAVDQAWHLHLTFTRSYWIDLCRDTLGREIHHNPTLGGGIEARKFNRFYTSTHELYRRCFDEEPPADIWPDNGERFSDIDFQRVNRSKNWVLRKPSPTMKVVLLVLLSLAVSGIALLFLSVFDSLFLGGLMGILVYNITTPRAHRVSPDGGGDPDADGFDTDSIADGHHGHGCSSGCSGCSASGCSGCSSGCSGCGSD